MGQDSRECYHFRMDTGKRWFVLEDASSRVIGIEVKSSASIDRGDFTGPLNSIPPEKTGAWHRAAPDHMTPFAKDLHAVPMSALWEW